MISYIIKATVNKCQHAHDEATNTLLRGSENTKILTANLHNRDDLQYPDKPNDRFILLLRSKNHH